MSLEVVRGVTRNHIAMKSLIDTLKGLDVNGILYSGYPIISYAESSYTIEALLVSPEHGLIAFNFPNNQDAIESVIDAQDRIFYLIEGNLKKNEALRKGRTLAITPNVISFYPTDNDVPNTDNADIGMFAGPEVLPEVLLRCTRIEGSYFRTVCAAIQRVLNIRPPKKRENVKKPDSKGAILKRIEKEIANLDEWQQKAAIEVLDGPQRIRGLAGSGKTIVLALKAAYLHAQHPDWDIVVTFHTRSLSQQFKELIERFTLEHSGDKPDWDRLRILHAWGSSSEPGVYSEIAEAISVNPMNFAVAKDKYRASGAFEGICNELLSYINSSKMSPIYDAVIIDEAQDLPISFFRIVYEATKPPKRIFWAYDELQNLNNTAMPTVDELFGKDSNGLARVSVRNTVDEGQQDIFLPVCYRNTPWALTLAHALGFGIYRKAGLVQLFDDLGLWEEVGYTVEAGVLDYDQNVTLKRKSDSFPSYFQELMKTEETVITKSFDDYIEQYEWIASEIQRNIEEDELDPDDILIIFPNAITAKQEFQDFNASLSRRGIFSHLAGVSTDRDTFTKKNSVTSSSIYRAKGNEAPMVYITNSEWCAIGQEMIKLRNVLFTAITRSRAWVRICGVGEGMSILGEEISRVQEREYKLSFRIPTKEGLSEIRLINRDRTSDELSKITKAKRSIKELKRLIETGVINPDTFPELKELLNSTRASEASEDE